MLLRLAIAAWSFVTTLVRNTCASNLNSERSGFCLMLRSSACLVNPKYSVSLIRSRCFAGRSSREAASSVPAQATWLRLNLFASAPALVSSGLRLAAVRTMCHHRPNRAVKRDARLTSLFPSNRLARAPLTLFRWASRVAIKFPSQLTSCHHAINLRGVTCPL
jgi:hypothetical protein